MSNETNMKDIQKELLGRLSVITTLLAKQVVQEREILGLNKKQKIQDTVWMLNGLGLDRNEIAAVLNTNPDRVSAHISNMKKKLEDQKKAKKRSKTENEQ